MITEYFQNRKEEKQQIYNIYLEHKSQISSLKPGEGHYTYQAYYYNHNGVIGACLFGAKYGNVYFLNNLIKEFGRIK